MKAERKKIAVLGAGAVGSALGGFLCRAGHAVTLIGRRSGPGSHLERVRSSGLTVDGIKGRFECRPGVADRIPEGADAPDLILLTVKSFDTREAAETIARAAVDCPVLHLQNGIGNYEILSEVLGAGRVLTGMIIIGFTLSEPGTVHVTVYGGDIKIGCLSPAGPGQDAVRQVTEIFDDLPLTAHAAEDIESYLWAKLLYNCALNPLGAIFGVPYGRLLDEPAQEIIKSVLAEAFAVAGALGVPLFWPSSEVYRAFLTGTQIPATADHFPSMGADLRAGKPTEIDFLNGAVVRAGTELGLATPVNETLCRQIHFLENSPPEPAR